MMNRHQTSFGTDSSISGFVDHGKSRKRKRPSNNTSHDNYAGFGSLNVFGDKNSFHHHKQNNKHSSLKQQQLSYENMSLPACSDSDTIPIMGDTEKAKKPRLSTSVMEESPIIKRYRENQHSCFGCSHIGSSLPLIEDESLENLIFLFYNIKNTNINIHCINIHNYYETHIRSKYKKIENGVEVFLLPPWTPNMIKDHLLYHQSDPSITIQIIMQKLTASIYHIFGTSLHTKKKIYLDSDEDDEKNKPSSTNNPPSSVFLDQHNPFNGDEEEDRDLNNYYQNNLEDDDGGSRAMNNYAVNSNVNNEEEENNSPSGEEEAWNEEGFENLPLELEEEEEEEDKTNKFSGIIDYNHELIGEEYDPIKRKNRKYIIQYDINANSYKILDGMIKNYIILGKSNPKETMKEFISQGTLDRMNEKKISSHAFFESGTKKLKPSNSLKTTTTTTQTLTSSTLNQSSVNYHY